MNHPRKLTDEMIRTVADSGGVIGVNICSAFLNSKFLNPANRKSDYLKYICYIMNADGEDILSIGSDFDGITGNLEIATVLEMNGFLKEMKSAGITEKQIEKFSYRIVERVLKDSLSERTKYNESKGQIMKSVAIILMIISALSKVMGFLREMVFSYFYGTSAVKDAYVIATSAPGLIVSFVGTAITIGFIPVYNRILKEMSKEQANLYTSKITNILFIIITIAILIIELFPVPFVKLFAGGFTGETLATTVSFLRIVIVTVYFTCFFSLYQGYLNAHDVFIPSVVAPFMMNIIVILFTIAAGTIDNIFLPIGFFLGYLAQLIFLYPFLRKKEFTYTPSFNFKDRYVKLFLELAAPMMLAMVVQNVGTIIDKNIASFIAVGGISSLEYANRLVNMVQMILITSIATSIYPTMSQLGVRKEYRKLKEVASNNIAVMMRLLIPATIGLMLLSEPITAFVYGRGEFGQESILMTSGALFYYAPLLIGLGITDIFNRVFYSLEDTKTPVFLSIISIVVDIVLNITLSRFMGLNGLALSTSIGRFVNAILLYIYLRKRIQGIGLKNISGKVVKIIIASGIMGAVVYILKGVLLNTLPLVLSVLVMVAAAGILYIALVFLFGIIRLEDARKIIKTKLKR